MLPNLTQISTKRRTQSTFPGLDLRARGEEGSCSAMQNLCGGDYPLLATRPARGLVAQLQNPGALHARGCLCYAAGTKLYVNGQGVDLSLTQGRKQLVSMGAYLLVFPDKKYLNTQDLTDFGSMEHTVSLTGSVTATLCDASGAPLALTASDEAPESPSQGAYWLCSQGPTLYRYESGAFEPVQGYTRLSASGIGQGFSAGDGIYLEENDALPQGLYCLQSAKDDEILLPYTLECPQKTVSGGLSLRRTVPDMDYVTECGNRLFGCKYGMVGGEPVNELYCCKLGDFKNWHSFQGLSTDAWRASRGADGAFTGAITYQGSVLFFREQCLERIYPSATGAHQVTTEQIPGVLRGCSGTLQRLGGQLLYLSGGGVMVYDGAMPVCVSKKLGALPCLSACAGALGTDYYLSLHTESGDRLLQYDLQHGGWYEQDDLPVLDFAALDWQLYALCRDGRILSLLGGEGEDEEPFAWSLTLQPVAGDAQGYRTLSRLRLRCLLAGSMTLYLRYDGETQWHTCGTVSSLGLKTLTLPIVPRRCQRLQLRLAGTGAFRLYSLSHFLEEGSDAP